MPHPVTRNNGKPFKEICVVFVPSVTPAILIGRALNLDAASISYIIGMTEVWEAIDWCSRAIRP